MLQTLRTLIVDDEPLAIERLQILAGQQDGVSLVGTASDGAWSVDLGEGGVHRIGRTYLHDVKAIMHGA